MAASRFGESLNWTAVKHQHQNPRAGPKKPHSSTLGFRNSLAPAPGAVAFVMNEREEQKQEELGEWVRGGRVVGTQLPAELDAALE